MRLLLVARGPLVVYFALLAVYAITGRWGWLFAALVFGGVAGLALIVAGVRSR